MNKIRVLLVDDHRLIRQGIASLLNSEPDMEVVAEAGDGKEALHKAEEVHPDVVLMDLGMPEMNGLQATRELKKLLPEVRVLVLTVHDREDYLFNALSAGASGYVLKGADIHDLVAAVRTVHQGEIFLYPTMTSKLVRDYLQRAASGDARASYDGLTEREREVLRLIAQGHTNQQIAEILYLSIHTVQTHRENVMKKLNLHTRTELIKYALRKGLIKTDI